MQAAANMLEAQAQEIARLRQLLAQTAGVAITMLYDSHKEDVIKAFSVEELTQIVAFTQPLAVADSNVEHVYRYAWLQAQTGVSGAKP